MYKTISDLRSHDPLDAAERETVEDKPSSLVNFFGIALIALCVVGALALMLASLRA